MKDFEFDISPVETYRPPDIPIFGDDNPTLLKKLPKRWQKKAKVIACMGLIGVFALSGCAAPVEQWILNFEQRLQDNVRTARVSYGGYSAVELAIRVHTGGGGVSFYVVHLTEQEALGIIRARLEKAGLNFDANPPGYTIGEDGTFWWGSEISLDLFDEQKNVAITSLSWEESNRPFSAWGRDFAAMVESEFAELTSDIIVGAFYNPGASRRSPHVQRGDGNWVRSRMSAREAAESIPTLKARLNSQVDRFIAFLQSEGVLELQQEVRVMLNEELLEFDTALIMKNDQVMVPSPGIFEALGMEVESDPSWGVAATKNDRLITFNVNHNRHVMSVSDIEDEWDAWDWIDIDTPAFMHGDIIMIPLQYLAEAIRATVEWDEGTRTIRITTN